MRSATRATAVTGVGALIIAGVTACGSSGGAGQETAGGTGGTAASGHVVQAAYTATEKAKTASFRFAESIRAKGSSGSSQAVAITGQGQADFATKAFSASVNVPSGGVLKIMLVRGTEYVQVPPADRSRIPGHKKWVSVHLKKVSQAKLGASLGQFSSASSNDPSQALSQLSAVSSGVTKEGTATVAGVPTTEYRAKVDLNKVAARTQTMEGAEAAQAVRQEIKALGTATVPVQVWIDAHHLVRQIRYQVPIPAAGTGGTAGRGTAESTVTFTGFGAPVHLSPPPAGETADITSQVLQQASAGSG
jgi:hypothetical protein